MNEVHAAARSNNVDKLVLDIRQNGGGNNFLVPLILRPIIQLEDLDKRGKLFVIIGRQTFSAAQNLTNALEKYTNATFVGEPTASHVNMFGDAVRFTLPNSKITVRASTLWHQDFWELDKRTWTVPQVAAPLTFADYAQNVDTALQAVIDYKPQKSVTEIAMELSAANELGAFKTKVLDYLHNPVNAYQNVESEINAVGYRLMGMKKLNEAIEVFKVNTELYSASANAFDSLAEAYANAGNREEAIKNYEKALRIDPEFRSSIEALQKLNGK
jgi:tetratricopeptide (TPR) repeat protein